MIITIDGEAASGKGTLGKLLAKELNFAYLDTGLLYRLTAYLAAQEGVISDSEKIVELAENIKIEHLDYALMNEELKSEATAILASKVSSILEVRVVLLNLQKEFIQRFIIQGAILDGRDIGTVIYPEAEIKFFITADPKERAKRRYKEIQEEALKKTTGKDSDAEKAMLTYEEILQSLINRDFSDKNRPHGTLKKAPDAKEINTTDLSIQEAFDEAYEYIQNYLKHSKI
ncbi:(d)CMP kinase [Candidatus Hepatincolaceae symbiont of Richtersius coronifer]